MRDLEKRIQSRAEDYYVNKKAYQRAKHRYQSENAFWIIFPAIFIFCALASYAFNNLYILYTGIILGLLPILLLFIIKKFRKY